jgi:hypothetical protein
MSISLVAALGVLAGLVALADPLPYIRDIMRRATRPHRGTWLIWTVLATVAFAAQEADGAAWSLVMAGAQMLATTVVFVLALRHGVGGVSPGELALLGLAGLGVGGWLVADEPVVATLFVVGADVIGVAMMVPKTVRDPHSETLSTFVLASLSGALALGAVGALDASLLLYPSYFLLANGFIAALIWWRRRQTAVVAALA